MYKTMINLYKNIKCITSIHILLEIRVKVYKQKYHDTKQYDMISSHLISNDMISYHVISYHVLWARQSGGHNPWNTCEEGLGWKT